MTFIIMNYLVLFVNNCEENREIIRLKWYFLMNIMMIAQPITG